jgi:hypothetical protein
MPNMIAENTSRPWSSVPSQNFGLAPSCQTGGSDASIRLMVARSNGLCGATHCANSAEKIITNATTAATIATGDCRKL